MSNAKILWSIVGISIIAAAFWGPKILLLIFGVIIITLGFLRVFSKKFDAAVHRHFPESASDRRVFSKYFLYITRRYDAGFGLIIVGIGAVLFYLY